MNEKDKLVRGSIRVFKDDRFYEEREVRQVDITYNDLVATLPAISIPKALQKIFDEAKIFWRPNTHNGCRLRKEIKGLDFDDIIESADENYLKVKFSGLTKSALKAKLDDANKWLDEQGISHGEKDGKVACIFKCLTSQQLEMGDF